MRKERWPLNCECIPSVLKIIEGHLKRLADREVDLEDLSITTSLSLEVNEYVHDLVQATAGRKLIRAEGKIAAAQSIQYIFQIPRLRTRRIVLFFLIFPRRILNMTPKSIVPSQLVQLAKFLLP